MALISLEGAGVWVPYFPPASAASLANNVYIIDAAGEKAVLIFRCPKAGSLDRFDFNIGTVGNSPDNGLRASFQGVNAADGQNDGTILGATNNAFVTYAHTVTTGWKSTNFAETVTVTRGQLIAAVIDIPTFTAGDSVSLSHLNHGGGASSIFPYSLNVAGTKQTSNLLIVAPHYTDGYTFLASYLPGVNAATTVAYNVDTAVADEWGLGFQLRWPAKLNLIGVKGSVAAAADFEVNVYDSADNVLSSVSHDGDVTGVATAGVITIPTATELVLAANTTYRVTNRPTTTNNFTLQYLGFNSAELMQNTIEGGDDFYMTSRIGQAGAWTDYNASSPGFRRAQIFLHLSALDDGAGGAGIARLVGRGLAA